MNPTPRFLIPALTASVLALSLAGCEPTGTALVEDNKQQQQQGDEQTSTATIHEGTISASETWTKAGGPHVVRGKVYVQSEQGATLTIEAGAQVRFELGAGLYFGYESGKRGVLDAQGTVEQPIVFASAASSPAKGDWAAVYLGNGAASSMMSHCTISHGGGGSEAALIVEGAGNKPAVMNCTIEQSASLGIKLSADAYFVAFENNVVKTSASNPIRLGANEAGSLGSGNRFEENGVQAIHVDAGTVSRSTSWLPQGVPYRLHGTTYVQHETIAPVLAIKPGATLEFGPEAALKVAHGSGTQGALYAIGTAEAPITFRGVSTEPGSWAGISMGEGTVAGAELSVNTTVIQHAVIEHGGGGNTNDSALLYLYNAKPLVENVTFRHSGSTKAVVVRGVRSKVPTFDSWGLFGDNGSGNVWGAGLEMPAVEDAAQNDS